MPNNASIPTTIQSLGTLSKSARDIRHKDIHLHQGYGGQEGINGDLDRLPVLTWLMFLEFLDPLLPAILDKAFKGEL